MCSAAVEESNRFHCRFVPSLTACRPRLRSVQPCENPCCTSDVASKLTSPAAVQPAGEPTAWLPGAVAVCPPSHDGWLFQLTFVVNPPITHNFAFEAGLHVHDHFCVISK